jgi:hypothetical protein
MGSRSRRKDAQSSHRRAPTARLASPSTKDPGVPRLNSATGHHSGRSAADQEKESADTVVGALFRLVPREEGERSRGREQQCKMWAAPVRPPSRPRRKQTRGRSRRKRTRGCSICTLRRRVGRRSWQTSGASPPPTSRRPAHSGAAPATAGALLYGRPARRGKEPSREHRRRPTCWRASSS